MDSDTSVNYTVFLYREELRRTQSRFKHLNKAKTSLTDQLISRGMRNLERCSIEYLLDLKQEILFKMQLNDDMKRIKDLEKLGLKNVNPKEIPSTDL